MYKSNYLKLEIQAQAENVALVRLALSGFLSRYDLSIEVMEEIKIALSEAVTNAIIHGYGNREENMVAIEFRYRDSELEIVVKDDGVGIEDVKKAMEVAYSTKAEHMGLGFAFMGSFTDHLQVESKVGQGTVVHMRRRLEDAFVKNAV